ncbi:multidrug transporter [Capsulimonas corticalis]|uniref:Multidrug transporter n=1 Tax=Capsulimonas corticalis TaxID=2219043 RepID=A0A402CS20_9BACT|nr:TolC family protein [Capsulimonas corticalis]BDI28220.1 multidrug transporter [Capsulimonas corticalis]
MIVISSLYLAAALLGQPVLAADTAAAPPITADTPVTADAPVIIGPPPRVQDPSIPPPVTTPPPDAVNADVAGAPLTADEAARIALRLQPSLGDATGAAQSARGRTQEAKSAQNPQVIAGAGFDTVSKISGDATGVLTAPTGATSAGVSPTYKYSTSIALRQLLYDFHQTRNLVRQNRSLTEAAEANVTRSQQDLVLTVKTNFYNYANAQRLSDVNAQNVANRQRQLDLASSRLRNGIGLPSDAVTAETSKSQAILALNVARDNAEQARVTLLQSMGVDPLTPITPADTSETAPASDDVKALIQTGLRARPEVRAAERTLAESRYGLGAAKALNLPSLYATVGAGAAGNDFPLKQNVSTIGVGVQFPLIDGGQRSGAVQAANGQITTAQADYDAAVLNVRTQVASAYLGLASAEQRVSIVSAEVANAREGVRIAEGRYGAGLGLFQDITTAQGLLLTALTDQSTAQNALNLARTNLRRAIGETLSR